MENIKILEKHFRKGMIHDNFDLFKKDYPTLLKCILGAMDEALSQHDVIKNEVAVCDCTNEWHEYDIATLGRCPECRQGN